MPTFKNTSDQVFQDGDIILKPGEDISTEDPARVEQLRVQYAWQFSESKGERAPSEAEVKAEGPTKGVRPSVGGDYVEVDNKGKQSKKIG